MEPKLMPMHASCKIRALGTLAVAVVVAGCATHAHKGVPAAPGTPAAVAKAGVGAAYQVVASDSLLVIRVYRGGTLARAGHNHIIASHELSGSVYVPKDVSHSSFELILPVASLTVDEAELRAAQGVDFSADVPDAAAKEGTRRNMLGPALLDADHYPQVILHCEALEPQADQVSARVEVQIRGELHVFVAPVSYTLAPNELLAQGEFRLKQSDLGLQPFTALLGALAVQDEMQLQFRIVARTE